MVWQPATQLGCGIASCDPVGAPGTLTNPFGNDWWLVVCQFNAIQSGGRPYNCDYDRNGSLESVCTDANQIFEDGFADGAIPAPWSDVEP
jgi:hypothetical protein